MRKLLWGVLLLLSLCAAPLYAAPLGKPGLSATYRLEADPAKRPEYERANKLTVVKAQLALGPVVRVGSRDFQWAGLAFTRLNGQSYQAWLLMDDWPHPDRAPKVARYCWYQPDWLDAAEYVHESTGQPVLPRLSLWEYGWPRQSGGKAPLALPNGEEFPAQIELQGWPFKKTEADPGAPLAPPEKVTRIKLNPDLLIGFSNEYRDTEGRHMAALGKSKYDFVATGEADWRQDMAAGINVNRGKDFPPWLWRTEVYVNRIFYLPEDWPATLYRSNYYGRAMYVDEPAIHYSDWADHQANFAGKLTPAESARMLEKWAVDPIQAKTGSYSAYWINDLVDQRFGRGNLTLVEHNYPIWEAAWQTVWYELAPPNGAGGQVDEDFSPESLVPSLNRAFGTQIPNTLANACAIRIAVSRGACRNFHKTWGTSRYAQTPASLSAERDQVVLRTLYEAGASYFWFWNGWPSTNGAPAMNESHVPYPYKRASATLIRQAYTQHPNRDMDALLHAARACVVLPYGYTFSSFPMQNVKWLQLDRKNASNLTYRHILSNAATEVENYLRLGTPFDIAIDEPRFKPQGYQELVYVREDGTLRIVRPGRQDEIRNSPRAPQRADLGPALPNPPGPFPSANDKAVRAREGGEGATGPVSYGFARWIWMGKAGG